MKKHRPFEYIVAAVINVVVLYLVNRVPGWNISVVLPSFSEVLLPLRIYLIAQIAGNAVLVFYHPNYFHHSVQLVFSLLGVFVSIVMLSVFPFDFSTSIGPWLNQVARVVLTVGAVGSGVSALVNLVGALRSSREE